MGYRLCKPEALYHVLDAKGSDAGVHHENSWAPQMAPAAAQFKSNLAYFKAEGVKDTSPEQFISKPQVRPVALGGYLLCIIFWLKG